MSLTAATNRKGSTSPSSVELPVMFISFWLIPSPTTPTPNWKHSYLNDHTGTKDPFKKRRRQKSSWHSDQVGSGLEYQYSACQRATAGAPKVSPQGGLWFLRGHWKRADFPTTYSLLETTFTPPCWPHNICLSFQQQRSSFFLLAF